MFDTELVFLLIKIILGKCKTPKVFISYRALDPDLFLLFICCWHNTWQVRVIADLIPITLSWI